MNEAVRLTGELVRLESTNPGAGERLVEQKIKEYLDGCGAEIRTDEVLPGRKNVAATIGAGRPGPMLVLSCHMDTVVAGAGWTKPPFGGELENGRIYGRGACDMKGGLACALAVFRRTAQALLAGTIELSHPLRLLCTVDEEGDMRGIEAAIEKGVVGTEDWVLDLEPTGGEIQMAHKGRLWLLVKIHGVTAHASRPEQGADAIAGAAEFLHHFRDAFGQLPPHPQMGSSTVTFGQIQGGYQPYVVPDACQIWVDMRLSPPVDRERVMKLFDRAAEQAMQAVPGVSIAYEITGDRPAVEIHEDSRLLCVLKEAVFQETGEQKAAGVFPGYTDTAVIAGRTGNKNCMSYGPGDLKMAHKPDEYVETADLERCERVLEAVVRTLVLEQCV